MYRQSRYQRKGSKVKRLLHASVFLGVVVWLLYETKHSMEGKKGDTKDDYNNLSKVEEEMYFGRKVNPGSQYGLSTSGAAESGGNQADAFDWHSEEKTEEALKIENEESLEDIMDSGEDEDKQGNFDDVTESHINDDLNSENLDQKESNDGAADSNEENGGNDEATASDEVPSSSSENSGRGSEPGEIGEGSVESEVPENSTDSGDTGDEKNDNVSVEQITANPRSDDVDINSTVSSNVEALERDEVDSRRTNPQEAETNDQHYADAASTKSSTGENNVVTLAKTQATIDKSSMEAAIAKASKAVNANFKNSSEEHKEVIEDYNGVDVKNNQVDSVSKGHNTGNSTEAGSAHTNPEGENVSDNNGKPKEEAVESQDHGSEDDSSSNSDEQTHVEKVDNNESSRREASDSEGSNASDTDATSEGTVKEAKSGVEVAMVSLANKDEDIDLPANSEDAKVEGDVGSTGVGASDSEKSGSGSLEGAKSLSDGEFADSSQENKQNDSEVQASESGEAAESHGNGASETESTTTNTLEDTRLRSDFIDPTISSNKFGEESVDVERRGSTGSESSSSEEKNVDVKKSVEL